jgi:ubiquinone/menaquinone biosynthesis C-methylase UbiE
MTTLALENAWAARRADSPVDWNSYARCYDLLCSLNPAYVDLMQEFETFVRGARLPEGAKILDLGGGTGNFFCHALPQEIAQSSQLVHLDFDSQMLAIAQAKYKTLELNVETIHRDAAKSVFPVGSLDCIVSVNALYAMPEPVAILLRAFHWLRPGGAFFIVNLGRVQNTNDWTSFLVKSNVRRIGIIRTLRILLNEGMVISRANRKIAKAQLTGNYWQHSTEELQATLETIGFVLNDVRAVYRGYSDLACGRKPVL